MSTPADVAKAFRWALDPVLWAEEALGFVPDPWQARVLRSAAPQLLLCCSRQAGKSTVVSLLALHTALFQPDALVLILSRGQRQAGELLQKIVMSYRRLPDPPRLPEESSIAIRLANGSRVVSLPADPEAIRGYSAPRLVIEDEAAFVEDAVEQALRPMLATGSGRIALLSTPHGRRGHFFRAWEYEGDAWHRESVTAYQCPRISAAFLEAERKKIGEFWFRQEYECQFVAEEDQLFAPELIAAAFSSALKALPIVVGVRESA